MTLILKPVISLALEGDYEKVHGCRQYNTITPAKPRDEKTPGRAEALAKLACCEHNNIHQREKPKAHRCKKEKSVTGKIISYSIRYIT